MPCTPYVLLARSLAPFRCLPPYQTLLLLSRAAQAGNSRGNAFSRNHTGLDPAYAPFWDFTWDDMAAYDVPAMVDYVLQQSERGRMLGSMVCFCVSCAKGCELLGCGVAGFCAAGMLVEGATSFVPAVAQKLCSLLRRVCHTPAMAAGDLHHAAERVVVT